MVWLKLFCVCQESFSALLFTPFHKNSADDKTDQIRATLIVSPVSLQFLLRHSAKSKSAFYVMVAKWMCKFSDLSSLARFAFQNYSYSDELYEDHCMFFSVILQNIAKMLHVEFFL